MKKLALLCVAAAAVFFAPLDVRAATYTWSGAGFMGSQDFLWSNPFNWVGTAAPQTGETNIIIVLPNNGSPRTTTNDIAGLVIKSIRFQGDNYIVAGKTPGNSIALTFDRLTGDTIEATGDNGQFAPTISLVLTSSISAEVAAGKTFHLRATMNGMGGFTKNGPGTLHLNSPGNNYAGDTFVTDGILDLHTGLFGPTVAAPGDLTIGSTNLAYSPVVRLLNDDQIADTAVVTVNRNAKLWLNTYSDTIGSLTIGGGLVNTGQGGNPTSPGTLTLNGNVTNRFTAVGEFSTISGRLNLGASTRTFNVETSSELAIDANIGGNIIVPPGLIKTGGGLLTLYNATNTYGGTTYVDGGALKVSGKTQLLGNTNAGTVVTTNGQLQFEAFSAGQESLTLNGGLLVTLSYSGTNTWAGPVTLNGNCRVQGSKTFGPEDDLTFSGAVSGTGSLTKQGDGTLHFKGANANTFSGGLFAYGGWTELEKSGSAPALGGPLIVGTTNAYLPSIYVDVRANNQIPDNLPITILHGILAIQDGAADTIGNVEFVGGWILNFDGTLTLSGSVSNRPADLVSAIYGNVNLAAGTHFLHADAGTSFDVNGALNGSGAITKAGPGAFTFKNTNSYSGLTLIKNGFLRCFHNGRPGSSAAGTEIESSGVLSLDRTSFTNETLTLHGDPVNYSLYVRDQCSWNGNVSLLGEAGVQFEVANGLTNRLTINGQIGGGAGGLRIDGDGELVLTGSSDNTFGGQLWVRSSNAKLQKSSGALAVSGPLRIGESNASPINLRTVTLAANNQIGNTSPVQILDNGVLAIGSFSDAIGALTLRGGDVTSSGGLLTLGGDVTCQDSIFTGSVIFADLSLGGTTRQFQCDAGSSLILSGDIQDGGGSAGLTKTGPGFLSMNSLFNTYAGPTLVSAGIFELSGVPGASSGGTEVMPGVEFRLYGANVTNEVLTLHGNANGGPLVYFVLTNNVWKGPVTLQGNVGIQASSLFTNNGTPVTMRIDGPITGNGSLIYGGVGTLTLAGSSGNTYSGTTTVNEGTLRLDKTGGGPTPYAIPGSLFVGRTNTALDAIVRTASPGQFNANPLFRHTIYPSGHLYCDGFDQRIPSLTLIEGYIDTFGGVLVLDGDVIVGRNAAPSSSIHGKMTLGSIAVAGALRTLTISNAAHLDLSANVSDGANTTNLLLNGGGGLELTGSNSFSGIFTIEDGSVYARNNDAFGKPTGPTIVQTNGFITISGLGTPAKPVAEPFTFVDTPVNFFTLTAYQSNYLSGPIALQGHFVCDIPATNGLLVLSGPVSGAGVSWLQEGAGTLRLTGTNANTFSGELYQFDGMVELAKTNVTAVAGPFRIGGPFGMPGNAITRWFNSNQVADSSAVVIDVGGQAELQNFNETIGSVSGDGNLLLSSAMLTTGGDGTSTSFAGFISGIGGQIVKVGAGTLTLSGNNSYTGGSTVKEGVLLVNGQQPQSPVSLLTGGQIGGNGRVGNISALDGHVSPGTSPGKLACGNLSFFSPSSLLKIELGGTNAGVNYDQVEVNGSVLLMGGTLAVSMSFPGAISNQYVIVKNDGVDPVSGTFPGVPNGASITNGGVIFAVKYNGGDGNDIVLIQQNVSAGPQISGIQPIGSGRMSINGMGTPNTTYNVQATTNLNPPIVWAVIGSATSDAAGLINFLDTDVSNFPIRFYRLSLP